MKTSIREPGLAAAVMLACLPAASPAETPGERVLTSIVSAYPAPSRDGSVIAFQSNRGGSMQIWLMDANGGDPRRLTDEAGEAHTPSWSPDGRRIAYAASIGQDNTEIVVVNADGSGRIRLTDSPGDDSHPHWSHDGAWIVFNSDRETPDPAAPWARRWHDIYSMRPDGSGLRRHTRCESICTYGSLSPDGKRIAFRKVTNTPGMQWTLEPAARNSEVFVADLDGGNERNLSSSAAYDGWPAWSPDGRVVAFSSNRSGPAWTGQVWLADIETGALTRVTAGPWSYVQPAWSADGSLIYAFRNEERDGYETGEVAVIPVR